mmetsp:Transcript_15524/g.50935  ORF Transcript_15524/g.50935 Transcript_15524/m.50935 type:complete len:202 (-) Transcript_15524:991-1596(-)
MTTDRIAGESVMRNIPQVSPPETFAPVAATHRRNPVSGALDEFDEKESLLPREHTGSGYGTRFASCARNSSIVARVAFCARRTSVGGASSEISANPTRTCAATVFVHPRFCIVERNGATFCFKDSRGCTAAAPKHPPTEQPGHRGLEGGPCSNIGSTPSLCGFSIPTTQRYDAHIPQSPGWCGWHQCPKDCLTLTRTTFAD